MTIRRIASVIRLRHDAIETYEDLHRIVDDQVTRRLTLSNIRNYSIFRYGDLLFAYFEYVGIDLQLDLEAVESDPASQKWNSVCSSLQIPVAERDEGAWWAPIPEVFHLD